MSAARPIEAPALLSSTDRWYVLGVLTLVYAFNIADRFGVSTLIEPIRSELGLSDSGIAFLTGSALALFYVTVGIPIATLADRANRRNIVAAALAIWSAMTVLCGLAQTYLQLLLARIGVGVGEAGGTPPSTSIIADKFAPGQRPMALTIFALGAPLGAWLGSSVAGLIADRYGWRGAFIALGGPGLLLALIVALSVREPRRGELDASSSLSQPMSLRATLAYLSRTHSALHVVAAGTVATLWSWGLMWWTPTFLVRSHGMTVGEAGAALGPMHLIAGAAATLLAGWLMARPAASDPRHITRLLLWTTAVGTGLSILVYAVDSTALAIALLWLFVPACYFFLGPILGLLSNLAPAGMRAQACAVLLFTSNIANLILAPQLVGLASDVLAGAAAEQSLRWALLMLAPTGWWAAFHLHAAARSVRADQAAVSGL